MSCDLMAGKSSPLNESDEKQYGSPISFVFSKYPRLSLTESPPKYLETGCFAIHDASQAAIL